MYKLRRSRFMKFIAGILILTLTAAIVVNIVGAVIIMDENLWYASRQQIQQKVYSYVYDYTASDLMRYLRVAENMYCNNDTYKNYHTSEIELYRSKYSSENSNIFFTIKDEHGNILLKNDNIINDDYFTFSSVFTTDTTGYFNGWYVQGDSEKSEAVTQAQITVFQSVPETTALYEYETDEYYVDTGYEELAVTESTTVEDNGIPEPVNEIRPEIQVPEIDNTSLMFETVTVDNNNSDNETEILYYYSGELNYDILDYCKSILSDLQYNITNITFYQDDFYCNEYNEIVCTYNANDLSVPTKSFSTNFIYDSKEIPVTYSYNGSLYFDEFESRLMYLSLILRNLDSDNLFFNYRQRGRINLQVEVHVPYSAYANDIYNIAEELVDIAIAYKNNIVLITVLEAILLIVSFVYIFWSAGYIPKRDEPVARRLHGIPFDLYLFISILAAIGCLAMAATGDELFIVLGIIGLIIIAISLIYTIPVRVRTHTLKSNNLICKVYKAVKHAAAVTDEATGSRLAIGLILCAFIIVSIIEIVFFNVWHEYTASAVIMIARIIEIPFILFALVALTALHNGAKAISKGDTSYRIRSSLLFGPLKRHAQYLNSINDAVNMAVDERVKSESLKTELITNVSHDLKTPLTSIVNYVDLLKKTDITDKKALEYIDVIDRQSQRLKKLTVDIVEASKAATGNIDVSRENTALNVILLQTNGEYIERLEEKSLTLVQEIPEKDIIVSTDGRLLWRVIDNLMNNICKYSMPGTRVYLTLWENNGRAFISFRNISRNKLNISPENLTERFVRGDTSRNTEGSGLGLSIANSLTEIMGGKLSIIIDGDLFKVTLSFPTTDA